MPVAPPVTTATFPPRPFTLHLSRGVGSGPCPYPPEPTAPLRLQVTCANSLKKPYMPSAALIWQRIVFALCVIGLFAVAECAWATYNLQGDVFGGVVNAPVPTAPFLDRFESVVPGSLADRSGIRAGDALDLRLMPPAARYWERNELLAGVPIRLP